jgi:hypothetical protein
MSNAFEEAPVIRCMGCSGQHEKCLSQQDAERFIHRTIELLEFLGKSLPHGPTPGVQAVLDEYKERWL